MLSAPGLADCPKDIHYAEMNLKHTGNEELTLNLVKRAIRMGYDVVVINREIGDPYSQETDSEAPSDEPPIKKKKKGGKGDGEDRRIATMSIPDPFLIDESKLNLDSLNRNGRRFRQYSELNISVSTLPIYNTSLNGRYGNRKVIGITSWWNEVFSVSSQIVKNAAQEMKPHVEHSSRITVSLNESSCVHTLLNNPQLKKFSLECAGGDYHSSEVFGYEFIETALFPPSYDYDLVAVRPGDESILNTLTRKTDHIDIITYANEAKVPWIMKQKLIDAIRTEGVGFEIEYSVALGDSYARRLFLTNARLLRQSTRGKGVIFASGAQSLINLRAPVDAMNMTLLFGVDGNKAKRYISDNCRQILLRAETKRTVKGSLSVDNCDKVPSKNKSTEEALRRLMAVPEFKCQIERIPSQNKEETNV